MTYRLEGPERLHGITNSREVSLRDKRRARDVGRTKVAFPDASAVLVPEVETDIAAQEIQREESAELPVASPEQQTVLSNSN